MAREAHSILRVLGIVCLALAMVCAGGAAVLAARARPAYGSAALIKLTSPIYNARLSQAFRQAQANFPGQMGQPLMASVSIEPGPALDFYRVTALAESPQASAETANTLTRLLDESLRGADERPSVMLLQMAQAPDAPTRVHVKVILRWGLTLGGGFAVLGMLLLARALRRGAGQKPAG